MNSLSGTLPTAVGKSGGWLDLTTPDESRYPGSTRGDGPPGFSVRNDNALGRLLLQELVLGASCISLSHGIPISNRLGRPTVSTCAGRKSPFHRPSSLMHCPCRAAVAARYGSQLWVYEVSERPRRGKGVLARGHSPCGFDTERGVFWETKDRETGSTPTTGRASSPSPLPGRGLGGGRGVGPGGAQELEEFTVLHVSHGVPLAEGMTHREVGLPHPVEGELHD